MGEYLLTQWKIIEFFFLYARIQILEKNYIDALSNINKLIENESKYQNKIIESGIILCKIKILNYLEKYGEAFDLLMMLNDKYNVGFQMRILLEKLRCYIGLRKIDKCESIIDQLDISIINQNESLKIKYDDIKKIYEDTK